MDCACEVTGDETEETACRGGIAGNGGGGEDTEADELEEETVEEEAEDEDRGVAGVAGAARARLTFFFLLGCSGIADGGTAAYWGCGGMWP